MTAKIGIVIKTFCIIFVTPFFTGCATAYVSRGDPWTGKSAEPEAIAAAVAIDIVTSPIQALAIAGHAPLAPFIIAKQLEGESNDPEEPLAVQNVSTSENQKNTDEVNDFWLND